MQNKSDSPHTHTKSQIIDFPTIPATPADYVVEQGTSGMWTYRKWNSGISECWGTKLYSADCSSTWGSIYESAWLYCDNYPSGLFNNPPVLHYSFETNSTSAVLSIEESTRGTKTAPPHLIVTRATAGNINNGVYLNYSAKGRWK